MGSDEFSGLSPRSRSIVVSGDVDLSERLAGALQLLGPVEVAHSARYALGAIHDGEADVAVVDLDTPHGLALAQALSSLSPSFPVIGLSDEAGDRHPGTVLPRRLVVDAVLRVSVARALRETEFQQHPIAV